MSGAFKAIASVFMPKPEKAAAPPPPIPVTDPESVAARQATVQRLRDRARKGREGTIYSQAYGSANLGGTA